MLMELLLLAQEAVAAPALHDAAPWVAAGTNVGVIGMLYWMITVDRPKRDEQFQKSLTDLQTFHANQNATLYAEVGKLREAFERITDKSHDALVKCMDRMSQHEAIIRNLIEKLDK